MEKREILFEYYFHFGGFIVLDGQVPLLAYESGSEKFNSNYTATQEMLGKRILEIET